MNSDPKDPRSIQLRQILDEVTDLTSSPLYPYRIENGYRPVVGQGNHYAKIMFVGEAPGENEAKTGHPFCGASGRILDELLVSISLKREDVYVTNVVKDRPPKNRDPEPQEIALYGPFLEKQIEIIQPDVVATLGRHSMVYIMNTYGLAGRLASISLIHGQKFAIKTSTRNITYIPLYHPAVALYGASKKPMLLEDFQLLKEFV
ncbi:MAG: uracil-DNA glycosylase family protein [Candidatus Roizmanbacteria bacterium]